MCVLLVIIFCALLVMIFCAQVVIDGNRHVLLDVSPHPLASLTIRKGSSLVWGNYENLTLSAHYILVEGEFHIGSETCRFNKRANIKLRGNNKCKDELDTYRGMQ